MLDSLAHNATPQEGQVVSRRAFVRRVAAVVAGGAILTVGNRVLGPLWIVSAFPVALQRSTFAKYLGETFQVTLESSDRVAVQLVQVRDLPIKAYKQVSAIPSVNQEHCFSLVFRGPSNKALEQATYHFEHGQIGYFPLFIVPMMPNRDASYYEAIFNRQQVGETPR